MSGEDDARPSSITSGYKSVFLSGLATLLPTILTFWVITAAYGFIERNAATPISSFIKEDLILGTDEGLRFARWFWDLSLDLPTPRERRPYRTPAVVAEDEKRVAAYKDEVYRRFPSWIGFVLAGLIIFVVGLFIASFIGRALWSLLEGWILKIPIIKSVYPSAKQMVDFILSSDDGGPQFDAVVAIEYPRDGQWTVGFITGHGRAEVRTQMGVDRLATVFIPFAPTPISGFVVFVAEDACVPLAMSVDQAFKFYVSGGVIGSDQVKALAAEAPKEPES